MTWVDEDRRLAIIAAEELENYLDSTQLLWRLDSKVGTLTPGNLLLSIKRINATDAFQTDLDYQAAVLRLDEIIKRRRASWEKKITLEIPYRIRLWKNSIDEILEEAFIDHSITSQVRNRVIIEILLDEVRTIDPRLMIQIDKADNMLKKIGTNGPFLWDSALETCFEKDKFWFLYLAKGEVNK